ncbi:MAG: mandelate racemase/muconate lactonizing enzyme family protein [Gemmataceae bacterium]
MKLTKLTADHVRVPLGKPSRIPLSDPKPAGLTAVDAVLVHLETDAGLTGLGFTYLIGPGAATVRSLIEGELVPLVLGEDPRETDKHFAKAEAHFRSVGFAGLAARAYSAVDVALWDLKAKAAEVPLFRVLGSAREAAPFFVSDLGLGGHDSAEVLKAAKPLMKQGATGVRIEIGGGDVQADAERVREISDGLGDDAWVGVAADGRFDLGTAQALAHFFEDIGIDWFEDPIPAADEIGYTKLAGLMETPLAVGSGFASREAFFRVIRTGHVRTIRPDIGRLGGITPLLKVASVAEAFQVSVCPVRMPEVGVHLACGLSVVSHVDSVSWFKDVFVGGPKLDGGKLVPGSEPGLGLKVK